MNPPCYDEDLVKSIIFRCLNNPSRIINVHPKSDYCLSNVIGALDGSHMNLFEAPSKLNKDAYFERKCRYTIHLQAVVDN
ncbi:5497_t:CDS:2 [Gigaspora margarita]|uniref:5497_t:CDS:1 n=1 Tax=Gigaspora margarita TaxID=4874 RepID=A0ABN7UU75_GIGMA|nr:5497_t:CDS:2 [Gigaspora margarita]